MNEEILIVDYCRRYNQFIWQKRDHLHQHQNEVDQNFLVQTKAKATPKPKAVPGPEDQQEGQNILYPPNQLGPVT